VAASLTSAQHSLSTSMRSVRLALRLCLAPRGCARATCTFCPWTGIAFFFRENWDGYTVSCSKAPRRSRTPAAVDVSADGIIVRTMVRPRPVWEFLCAASGLSAYGLIAPLVLFKGQADAGLISRTPCWPRCVSRLTTYYYLQDRQQQQQSANSVAISTEFPQNFPLSTPKGHFAFREDRQCDDVQARGC
jgi:hypothetical protein